MDCLCPRPAALKTVERVTCKENIGQVVRFEFQRAGHKFDANAGTPNPIGLLASWTPLFVAVGNTKVVASPLVENVVIPQPEAITEGGGDNSTIDGVEIVNGAGAITVTATLAEVPGRILAQLKDLQCEPDLVVYMVNGAGNIIANELDFAANPGDVYGGFPIQSLFVSDAGNEGLNTRDKATLRFALAYGWRDNIAIIKPTDFNARTQLIAPAV